MKSIFIDFCGVTHTKRFCVRYEAAGETLHLRNVTEIALFALSLWEVALVGLKAVWEMTQAVLGRQIRQIIALRRERRESRARLNAGRCHFVWPFAGITTVYDPEHVCLSLRRSGASAAVPPSSFPRLTSWPNSASGCPTTFQLTWSLPITPIIPKFSLASSHNLNWNLNSTGSLCVCEVA